MAGGEWTVACCHMVIVGVGCIKRTSLGDMASNVGFDMLVKPLPVLAGADCRFETEDEDVVGCGSIRKPDRKHRNSSHGGGNGGGDDDENGDGVGL